MTTETTSIFNNQNPPPGDNQNNGGSNTPNGGTPDPLVNLLAGIKNDRGEQKYKSVEDALNALKHSQDYIPQLSDKLRQQEQELAEAKAAAAKISELERTLQSLTQNNTPPAPATPASAGLSKEEIAELISNTLTTQQHAAVAKENLGKVVTTLTKSFGDKAEEVFYNKAKELGMSVVEINSLAAKSPQAAFKLLGLDGSPSASSAPNSGSINTGGFQPRQDSFVGKNSKPTLIGATTADLREETHNAKRMVDELHTQGLSVHDLTDPKVYFKHFK